MSVIYTAALPVRDQTVLFLSTLLHDERQRRGTRTDSRALSPFKQAVLILRWFLAAQAPKGEADTITVAFKKPQGGELTDDQKAHNKGHNGKRAVGERGNSLLKTTFKALRNVSLCPWKLGKIVAAACTSTTTAPHDHPAQQTVTRKGSLRSLGHAKCKIVCPQQLAAGNSLVGSHVPTDVDEVLSRPHLDGHLTPWHDPTRGSCYQKA
jgi:hypothetical protein